MAAEALRFDLCSLNPDKTTLHMNKKLRVLYIDDEQHVLDSTKIMLESFRDTHFEVAVEQDAKQAVPRAREIEPHVVLLDMYMPPSSGAEVAAELRATRGLEQIPILLYTISERILTSKELAMWNGLAGQLPCLMKDSTPIELKKKLIEVARAGGWCGNS